MYKYIIYKRQALLDYIAAKLLLSALLLVVVASFAIMAALFTEAWRFFEIVPLSNFLFGTYWSPQTGGIDSFGFLPVIAGSILITFIAIMLALPLGILCAIYFSEYASPSTKLIIRPIIEMLAGIPTIIYGYFAAIFVGPMIKDVAAKAGMVIQAENALAAGIVMGIMITPFIMVLINDSLASIPDDLRSASAALGATKSETIILVLLPAVRPSIIAAILLAISRAIGETMIVTMAAGLSAKFTFNPLESVTTVTSQIVNALVSDQEFDNPKTLAAFALGLILFILTFCFNIVSSFFNNKMIKSHEHR